MKEFEEWMEETVVTFLKTHGDMEHYKNEVNQFVEEHKKFADQVVVRKNILENHFFVLEPRCYRCFPR